GFQYTSHSFKQFIEKHQIIQSMSRVGRCIDNGPMENFWGIIKEEMYRLTTYNTFEELEKDIKAYIKFYNTKRVTLKMGLNISASEKPCMTSMHGIKHFIFLPVYLTGGSSMARMLFFNIYDLIVLSSYFNYLLHLRCDPFVFHHPQIQQFVPPRRLLDILKLHHLLNQSPSIAPPNEGQNLHHSKTYLLSYPSSCCPLRLPSADLP